LTGVGRGIICSIDERKKLLRNKALKRGGGSPGKGGLSAMKKKGKILLHEKKEKGLERDS